MAYTTIDDPAIYFNTVVYTGNDSTQSITGVGFQPDLVWGKNRATATHHAWQDSVRGNTKVIKSSKTDAETTITNMVTSFDSDGFSLGSDSDMNEGSGKSMVAWCWKAGTSFTNDASSTGIGSIDSTGSVNDTAGFSIVSYTGTGSNGTIKHGLSTAPTMIIAKNRSATSSWPIFNINIGNANGLFLNSTSAASSEAAFWNSTAPTSSVFSVGSSGDTNGSSNAQIAYCFAEKQGYSKFGSYKGNENNGDGTFVYTGFSPAFIMVKNTERAQNWSIHNNKMPGYNQINERLQANLADAVSTNNPVDLLSNGFKWRSNDGDTNGYTHNHIYMAFAHQPFVTSTGVPATAR